MIVIGIDNGLNGGIALIDDNENIRGLYPMPVIKGSKTEYDVGEISEIIKTSVKLDKDIKAIIEKAHVRPISGKRACFTNGFGYGLIQGLLNALNVSYEIVSPNEWMKEILKGYNTKDKKGSIKWCLKKYPNHRFKLTERCKNYHDGMTDATAIAVYGVRLYKQGGFKK